MAKQTKQAAEAPEGDEVAEGGGKGKTKLLAGVAALALLGGGYVVTSGGGSSADAAGPVEEPAPVAGAVVPLDAITLNLADGRFLKVEIALQLVAGAAPPAAGDVAGFAAPALDEAISLLGAMSYPELVAPGGRDAAKAALTERIAARYDGDVMGLYFTELVMQ